MNLPDHRTFVFAGMSGGRGVGFEQSEALRDRGAEAIMFTFQSLKKGIRTWWPETKELLSHPHRRWLDSGLFSVMREMAAKDTGSDYAGATKGFFQRLTTEKVAIPYQRARELVQEYESYLSEGAGDWDFVINLDFDCLWITTPKETLMPGPEFTARVDERLRAIVGDKLVCTWHGAFDPDYKRLDKLCRDSKYIAFGSDLKLTSRPSFYAAHRARSQGVEVHALGISSLSTMSKAPFYTADSASWIWCVVNNTYPDGQGGWVPFKTRSEYARYGSRHRYLRDFVEAAGYDPDDLHGTNRKAKFEIAVMLTQGLQDALPVLPSTGYTSSGLYSDS